MRGCANVCESANCNGGWKLNIKEEERRFRYFSKNWKYRNDIDVIAVRANCTFIGYADSGYNGAQITLTAKNYDRWIVLADSPDFKHMDENIESLKGLIRHLRTSQE